MTKAIQRLFIKNNTSFLEPFCDNTAFFSLFLQKIEPFLRSLRDYLPRSITAVRQGEIPSS